MPYLVLALLWAALLGFVAYLIAILFAPDRQIARIIGLVVAILVFYAQYGAW